MKPNFLNKSLKDKIVILVTHQLQFLKDCEDQDFLWHVLPILKSIYLQTDDVLYFRGDYAEDIYFILQGTIKMYSEEGNVFHKVSNG
jgi:CRP-like cAMP-binding protein